jgi:lysophospholipase L1-like esterase
MRSFRYPGHRIVLALVWATTALVTRGRIPLAAVLVLALASPVAAAAPAPTQYLALGDSLAWGDGASDPATTGYVPLLADYFAGMPHGGAKGLANLAVRGETTASFLAGQVGAAMAAIGDPSSDTRVVTLSLGGNDVGALLNDPSDICLADPTGDECRALVAVALQGAAQRFPVAVGSIMAALAADEGDERVFVMTVFNPFGGLGGPYETAIDVVLLGSDLEIDCTAAGTDPTAAGLNDIIACTAMAFGATVVDAYPVIGDQALELTHIGEGTLDTHPNDAGYALLAKAHRLES